MKNPEYFTAAGVSRSETLGYAASMARKAGHPVGVRFSSGSGATLLYVLDTPELKNAAFDEVVCPDTDPESPTVVTDVEECAEDAQSGTAA